MKNQISKHFPVSSLLIILLASLSAHAQPVAPDAGQTSRELLLLQDRSAIQKYSPYGAEIYAVPDTPGNGNAGADAARTPIPERTHIPVTTSTRINKPYGAEDYAVPDTPGNAGADAVPPLPPERTPILVTDETFAKDPGFAEARAAREARAALPDSTMLDGIHAARTTWLTTRMIDRFTRPSFAGETPIIQSEFLDNIPLYLTADEREFFMDVGKGDKSAAYAIGYIEDQRRAHKVMGQHEAVGLVTMFIDPVWLALLITVWVCIRLILHNLSNLRVRSR